MLILGIPKDCSEDEFEETLQEALRHLGRYRIIGRMFRREENAQAFLVELARDFDYALVPREIQGKGGLWEVMVKPPNSDNEFLNTLNHFLEEERRTLSDMNRVPGTYSKLFTYQNCYISRFLGLGSDSQCSEAASARANAVPRTGSLFWEHHGNPRVIGL